MVTLRVPAIAAPASRYAPLPIAAALAGGVAFGLLTMLDAGGLTPVWENGHWTTFSVAAVLIAAAGMRSAHGRERDVRRGVAAATVAWLLGMVAWLVQGGLGLVVVPAPSDVLFLATIGPTLWALDRALRHRLSDPSRRGVYLDGLIVLLSTATIMTLLFNGLVAGQDVLAGAILLALPIAFLAVAGALLVAALAIRASPGDGGAYALVVGTALLGAAYVPWVAAAPSVPAPGTWSNFLFSAGVLVLGYGGATFRLDPRGGARSERLGHLALEGLPVAAVGLVIVCLGAATLTDHDGRFIRLLGGSVIVTAVIRQVLLVREREAAVRRADETAADLAAAEERHRRLVEMIPAIVYIDERSGPEERRSRLTYVSPQALRVLGWAPGELLADPELWYSLLHPADAAGVEAAEDHHFATGEPLFQIVRMRSRDGREMWIRDEATLVRFPDGRLQSHGVLTDVTEQKEAETAVRASEEQQRRIIETASSAYISMDPRGIVTDWNERAVETFGWSRDEAIGRSVGDLIVPEAQRAQHEAGLRRHASSGVGPLVGRRTEVIARDRNGRHFPVELTIWPVRTDGELRYSALVHDITERRRLEEELRHQAFHDSLTGLANRALFVDRLEHALARRDGGVAVLLFDLDDFKLVNDGLGHPAGDSLLVQVAGRLTALVRPGDTAARLGGDEFAVLLEGVGEAVAVSVAERIIASFSTPFEVAGRRVVAQASVGLAGGHAGQASERVIRDADAAMYAAKRRGKGIWLSYEPSMAGDGLLEIELRADLKQAIDGGAIDVVYHPIVELPTRRVVAVEALARWNHPVRGGIEPGQFIPLAEATELIAPLGRYVMRTACRTVAGWQARGASDVPLRLNVNLSARQLLHPTLVDDVRAALDDAGLPPADLTLEITEGVIVEKAGASLAALEDLKALGVRIALDDFGTGYSSLSYLARLPIDTLKIDRSFVLDLESSRPAAALVRSILKIGQTLHLDTVAEGVETEEQLARLLALGARFAQGFLFGHPQPAGAAPPTITPRR